MFMIGLTSHVHYVVQHYCGLRLVSDQLFIVQNAKGKHLFQHPIQLTRIQLIFYGLCASFAIIAHSIVIQMDKWINGTEQSQAITC